MSSRLLFDHLIQKSKPVTTNSIEIECMVLLGPCRKKSAFNFSPRCYESAQFRLVSLVDRD